MVRTAHQATGAATGPPSRRGARRPAPTPAKQSLAGKCVPKQSLGTRQEKACTSQQDLWVKVSFSKGSHGILNRMIIP